MTFGDIFDGRMKISWNFMKFSSGHRKFFKKSSEMNQRGAMNPLTSYSGFITFWWVFLAKTNFLWSMLKKKLSLKNSTFFLFKKKNTQSLMRATARYIWNFFKIWVWRIISMLRRIRSTYRRIPYAHSKGTKIANIRHKNGGFWLILAELRHSEKAAKMSNFSKNVFSRKSSKIFLSNALFRFS